KFLNKCLPKFCESSESETNGACELRTVDIAQNIQMTTGLGFNISTVVDSGHASENACELPSLVISS
ncbi:MAG: hypothetical protein WA792_01510, partial [Pseudolabrys sp.]